MVEKETVANRPYTEEIKAEAAVAVKRPVLELEAGNARRRR